MITDDAGRPLADAVVMLAPESGTPMPAPVHFDKPGIVAIGCNIHDHMIAHVFVTEAPCVSVFA
jgi:hypothetical protein